MSAIPYLTLVDRRADAEPVQVLFVGEKLANASSIFRREDEAVEHQHVDTIQLAVDCMAEHAKTKKYDCIVVDARDVERTSPLNVVALTTLNATHMLVVISKAEHVEMFEGLMGIDRVLTDPVDPKQLISLIVESQLIQDIENELEISPEEPAETPIVEPANKAPANKTEIKLPKDPEGKPDGPGLVEQIVEENELEKNPVTEGFEASVSTVQKLDQGIWRHFVPLASFVYKKLAIIVLTALFLTFIAYGAMIVFFMGSTGWSMPFELSKGHKLVEKVERDLSSMNLRRNDIRQNLTIATVDKDSALRDTQDGELQLVLSKRTIESEIVLQNEEHISIGTQITRYKQVIKDFEKLNGKNKFATNLKSAFKNRLITKKSLNSGTLALLETMHRIAALQNDISMKKLELHRVEGRLIFLNSLLREVDQPNITIISSPSSELAHLAREAIQAKNTISKSKLAVEAAEKRLARLNNSLELISTNIASLEVTPMARAIHSPVTVLFVPYSNAENVFEGQTLYRCAVTIVWCSKVGEVGAKVDGETTGVHPLFGKPLRGTFVEARFSNPKFVTEDLIHAGRPPLGF